MFSYKGFTGQVEVVEDGIYYGCVVNTKDVITFQGNSLEEVQQAFEESVDDYLEWCQELKG